MLSNRLHHFSSAARRGWCLALWISSKRCQSDHWAPALQMINVVKSMVTKHAKPLFWTAGISGLLAAVPGVDPSSVQGFNTAVPAAIV
jgi:hypothetical protein